MKRGGGYKRVCSRVEGGERDFPRGVEEGEVGQKRADGRVGKISGNCRTKIKRK